MNWRNFILLLLACCLFSSKAMAEPTQLLTISAQTERIALNEKLSFRVTHDNFSLARLGLDNPERWQSFNVIKSYQSGADKPMLWASVRLFNRSRMPRPFIIDLGSAYIDRASSYIVNDNGDIVDSNTVNFNDALLNRPYISDQLMLPVEVPANQTVWLVIAIKQWPEQLNRLTLWAPQALQLHQQQKQTALGVNAGVLLLLAVAAFSLARGSRRLLQVSMGITTTAFMLLMLLHSGMWIAYFSPYSPEVAAYLLPYTKQWLLVSLAWLLRESSKRELIGKHWRHLNNASLLIFLTALVVQPWWEPLRSHSWLTLQATLWVGITLVMAWHMMSTARTRLVKWFMVLMVPLALIAWLLITPKVDIWWQGLSGIVLYSLLTANILALILAQLDQTVERLTRRINSLKKTKNYYRDAYWRFLKRSNEGWFELTTNHQWKRVSRQFLKIFGLHHADFLRRHWPTVDCLFGEQSITWNDVSRNESWQHLMSTERMDGKTIWLQIEIFSDGRGRILDVTQQVEAEMQLNFLAKHDALTGLLNATEFSRLLQRQLDKQQSLALLVVQLNGLQVVKDQIDSSTRDQALLQLVLNLRKKLSARARIARLNEHQVGLFLDDSEQAAFALAYQLIQACQEFRFATADRVFQLGAHVGIAMANEATINVRSLFHRAEDALKLAQQKGDYHVHSATYDDQRRLQSQAERDWELRLKQALHNEEWMLFQQPMVSANRSQDKHCFEVLLRLPESPSTDPDEALAPRQFLAAALQAGIMGKADRWLIRHVLESFAKTPFDAARLWRCHINLSVQSLADDELINFITQQIEQSNLRPDQLAFELAEPIVAENFNQAYRLFKELAALGCITVIDQFGTGFNSFRLLQQMPLKQIKINRFWVQNMLLDTVEAELVLSCIRLAKTVAIEVSAVGVENDETRTALLKQEVDYIQGYVCGRPVRWQQGDN